MGGMILTREGGEVRPERPTAGKGRPGIPNRLQQGMRDTLRSPIILAKLERKAECAPLCAHVQGSRGMPDEPYDRIGHIRVCGGNGPQGPFLPGIPGSIEYAGGIPGRSEIPTQFIKVGTIYGYIVGIDQ